MLYSILLSFTDDVIDSAVDLFERKPKCTRFRLTRSRKVFQQPTVKLTTGQRYIQIYPVLHRFTIYCGFQIFVYLVCGKTIEGHFVSFVLDRICNLDEEFQISNVLKNQGNSPCNY